MNGLNKDDIIRMALEAGFEEYHWTSLSGESELDRTLQVGEYPVGESVFKFAALVAAAEREACAALCDRGDPMLKPALTQFDCADLIRARGKE
jgi:hypothetical protein